MVISTILFIATFIFFLAVIKLRDTLDSGHLQQLHYSVRWTAYGILYIGLVLDTLLNWFFLSVTFLEIPREFLATQRVMRHKSNKEGWRRRQSIWWCKNWLSPFDKEHCGSN